ncbi:MAG: glycosyltransferase [Candidatus Moraniibacteriota bacterium]
MSKISFIIIAYNEEHAIGRCLEAILAQDGLEDFEIVVVNDGSKDKTARVVEGFVKNYPNIFLHSLNSNQGRGAARAKGIENAAGEYVAFIDADIVLPTHWLSICLSFMEKYDAVGGIAVPDGDVNYLYTLLDLKPKIVNPTTIVSGSNGLYKKAIFEATSFEKKLREGEDSVFNKAMLASDFKIKLIKSLIVEHRESRKLAASLKWLYEIGKGATRQLKQFREIRLPDIAYFVLIFILLSSLYLAIIFKMGIFLLSPLLFIFLVGVVHIRQKFYFELRRPLRYLVSFFVYWLLLLYYFVGRTVGWFMLTPKIPQKKKVMVCFDFEGKFGMPYDEDYDLIGTTHSLLNVLEKYRVKAVFFVVGKFIEENPALVKEIANRGHEIGIHGYAHEHLEKFSEVQLNQFSENLYRVEDLLEKLIGKRPSGFRAPYLMSPVFYSLEVYNLLAKHGYLWVSNREIRYPDELFRPDRIAIRSIWGKNNWFLRVTLVLLNLKMVLTESVTNKKGIAKIVANIRWLNNGADSFKRDTLIEVPVYSPLDCDLFGLPRPSEETPIDFIQYAIEVLTDGIRRKGELHVVTFHDWISGTGNRLQVLDKVLKVFSENNDVKFVSSIDK